MFIIQATDVFLQAKVIDNYKDTSLAHYGIINSCKSFMIQAGGLVKHYGPVTYGKWTDFVVS